MYFKLGTLHFFIHRCTSCRTGIIRILGKITIQEPMYKILLGKHICKECYSIGAYKE